MPFKDVKRNGFNKAFYYSSLYQIWNSFTPFGCSVELLYCFLLMGFVEHRILLYNIIKLERLLIKSLSGPFNEMFSTQIHRVT